MPLDALRAALGIVIAARDGAALARHVGRSPEAVSRVAAGTLIPSVKFQEELEGGLRLWAAGHLQHSRLGRPPSQSPDAFWADLEARSPSWVDQQRTLQSAHEEARAFSQVPPERRTAKQQQRLNATWRVYHRACQPASLQCWPGEESRNARRRVRQMQRAGDLPHVIYREDDESSWMPTRQQLQLRMIPRAEFEAWPMRLPARHPGHTARPALSSGDLKVRADSSLRLQEFRTALGQQRCQVAVARLCRGITEAARLADADPAIRPAT
jgi:hypothetical protein